MSLEVAVQENTKAIRDLIAALNRAPRGAEVAGPAASHPNGPTGDAAKLIDKAGKDAAAGKPAASTSPAGKTATTATPPSHPAPAAAGALNYMKDVQPIALKLVGAEGGRPKMVEILGKYNVRLGTELKPEQWPAFLADIKTALTEKGITV